MPIVHKIPIDFYLSMELRMQPFKVYFGTFLSMPQFHYCESLKPKIEKVNK